MTLIYHITHVDNIPGILGEGGLWSDAERLRRGLRVQSIAYQELKERRSERSVETLEGRCVAAGGNLADYVPFYFANRSPMLYAIHTGYVEEYTGGQAEVVYLVSSVERVVQMGTQWCFTDGHAVEALTDFFDSLDDFVTCGLDNRSSTGAGTIAQMTWIERGESKRSSWCTVTFPGMQWNLSRR